MKELVSFEIGSENRRGKKNQQLCKKKYNETVTNSNRNYFHISSRHADKEK